MFRIEDAGFFPEVVLVRRWVIGVLGYLEEGGFGERVGAGEVSLQAT